MLISEFCAGHRVSGGMRNGKQIYSSFLDRDAILLAPPFHKTYLHVDPEPAVSEQVPMQQMRIAIWYILYLRRHQLSGSDFPLILSGAGIGGLTLALTLGMHSEHHVDLYEAGAQISTIGAGISVWARTLEVLQLLGLHERMR